MRMAEQLSDHVWKSRLWPKIRAMSIRGSRAALWVASGLLLVISGCRWLSYIGNGMAYGDILGLPGYEKGLALFGAKAMHALIAALLTEAMAVAAITWDVTDIEKPTWRRIATALVVAPMVTAFTFAIVRGL